MKYLMDQVMQNKQLKIVVESDSIVEYYMMIESIRHATRLGPNFLTYMNIFELYYFDIEN